MLDEANRTSAPRNANHRILERRADTEAWYEQQPVGGYYSFLEAIFNAAPRMTVAERVVWMSLFCPGTAAQLNMPEPSASDVDAYHAKFAYELPVPEFIGRNGRNHMKNLHCYRRPHHYMENVPNE